MRKYSLLILTIFIQFFFISCASLQVVSSDFTENNFIFDRSETFFINPIKITSYNFIEDDDICYIMDEKLRFALVRDKKVNINDEKKRSDYVILPELIIKSYQERYNEKNYYLFSIKILSEDMVVCQFNYEYNGTSSIFNGKIQSIMIKKFINDFTKIIQR